MNPFSAPAGVCLDHQLRADLLSNSEAAAAPAIDWKAQSWCSLEALLTQNQRPFACRLGSRKRDPARRLRKRWVDDEQCEGVGGCEHNGDGDGAAFDNAGKSSAREQFERRPLQRLLNPG